MNMRSYTCCSSGTVNSKNMSSLSSLLKVIGEESRLKILCILRGGQHCVCEFENHIDLSQSLISHHLKDLKVAGLITDKKEKNWVYYSLTDKGKRIINSLFNLEKGNQK